MNTPIARGEGEVLFWVLHRDRLLEAVFQRDLHPDRHGFNSVEDVLEILSRRGHGVFFKGFFFTANVDRADEK
jgi:hypothetical protein